MLRGGDTGPAVVPGKSSESLLVQALRHEDGLEMPPKAPRLADEVVARFVKWIDAGAPAPTGASATAMVAPGLDDARRHWAFQPIARPDATGGERPGVGRNARRRVRPRQARRAQAGIPRPTRTGASGCAASRST